MKYITVAHFSGESNPQSKYHVSLTMVYYAIVPSAIYGCADSFSYVLKVFHICFIIMSTRSKIAI